MAITLFGVRCVAAGEGAAFGWAWPVFARVLQSSLRSGCESGLEGSAMAGQKKPPRFTATPGPDVSGTRVRRHPRFLGVERCGSAALKAVGKNAQGLGRILGLPAREQVDEGIGHLGACRLA